MTDDKITKNTRPPERKLLNKSLHGITEFNGPRSEPAGRGLDGFTAFKPSNTPPATPPVQTDASGEKK